MKITVISPTDYIKKEHEIITELFNNGLTNYHIKKPLYGKDKLKEYIKQIPEKFHNRIVIHSHHTLVRKFNLLGVHYSDRDLELNFRNWWREKMIAPRAEVLIKTTSHKKLATLYEKIEMDFNYVFLLPVFDPITGHYQSGYYEDGLKTAIKKSKEKIVVMGGVSIERLEKIIELGFYGMGLNSCLWDNDNPVEEYCKIIAKCNELGVLIE
ncbi:MAG TPA: thiamine phosphate synthase [Bacteroidia bacterium]|jgi:thiamine-phosphate pyrophosphorylase|nr:thiamine phosphate synthase [Bacteroidia bacterium]